METTSAQSQPITMRDYVGSVIAGRYSLDQYLAEGNFGAVYRATQIAYGIPLREVAIKISKRPMSDQEARKAFADAFTQLLATIDERRRSAASSAAPSTSTPPRPAKP